MAATVTWQYSDFRSQATPAAQLERLKLHLQEVSGFMVESSSKARTLKLSDTLLPHLQRELERLETKISLSRSIGQRGVLKFSRGGEA
jgi:hypothetical protein